MFLWKRIAAEPLQRQRFRPDALFLLQLLLLAALIAGYLRPFVETSAPGVERRPAHRGRSTPRRACRRASAAERASIWRAPRIAALVEALQRDDEAMLVTAAERPHVAVRWTADHARLTDRLDALASDRYADESRAGDRARARRGAGASARPGRGADRSAAGGERRDAARARARRLRAGRRDRRQRRHPEPDRGPAAVPRADRRHRDRARPQLRGTPAPAWSWRRGSTAIRGSGARSTSRRAPPSRCCSRIRRTAARSP